MATVTAKIRRVRWVAEPHALLSALGETREGARTVFVTVAERLRVGERVEIEVAFEGAAERFVIRGEVSSVRVRGSERLPAGASLVVDASHRQGLEKVVSFARGEKVSYTAREHPRIPLRLTAALRFRGQESKGHTEDMSLGGARLRVEGELPGMGEEVELVLTEGPLLLALKLTGRVMWLDFFERSRGLGVRFEGGGLGWRTRLARLLDEVAER